MLRQCPDCEAGMMPEITDGVTVDVCPGCAGIWFDQGELGRLMHEHPGDLALLEEKEVPRVERRPDSASKRACPSCAETLSPYHYLYSSPILLDSCEKCGGIWVEDGEIHKVDLWVRSSRNPAADENVRADAAMTMVQFGIQHDAFMRRQQALRGFLGLIRRRPFGYWLGW